MRGSVVNLGLALIVFVVLAALLEGALRGFYEPEPARNLTPVPRHIVDSTRHPDLPYRLKPNGYAVHRFPSDPRGYFEQGASVAYRTNLLGLRGGKTTAHKRRGTRRILGVGDSYTFGTGVHEADLFLSVLQRALDANDGPGHYEVLNLGVMGYATPQEVALLEHVGLDLAPDLVVLVFVLNDAGGGALHAEFNRREVVGEGTGWRRSWLLDFLAARWARLRSTERMAARFREAYREDAAGWVEAQAALDRAQQLARDRDFELVLAIFPVLWRLGAGYPFADIHAIVRDAAVARSLPVLDLLPAFRAYDGPELWAHPTNQHPNEVAHRIVGEALYAFLAERSRLLRR